MSMIAKTFYHVRSSIGVTLDWTDSLDGALGLAAKHEAQVYAVNSLTGIANRIL